MLDSMPKYRYPLEGYSTNSNNYHQYLRLGRVVYYDPILTTVNLQWVDGYGGSSVNVNVGTISASGSSFSGAPPSIGDFFLVAKGRENFGNGRPYVVAHFPMLGEASRVNGFAYRELIDKYEFIYSKSPESGDVYHKSKKGAEVHLTQDLQLNNASMSRIEMLASQDLTHMSSRSFNFYGSGVWGNIGLAHRPMAFLTSGDSPSLKSLHKNEYDLESDSQIDSDIDSLDLEDGSFLYCVTPDKSSFNVDDDEDTKVYSEFDFLISETHEIDPIAMNSSDVISEDFTKPINEEGEGHLARFGFGTKIGRNSSVKQTYALPLKRNIFLGDYKDDCSGGSSSEEEVDKKALETEDLKKDQPLCKEDTTSLFSTAFWFNLFKKEEEVGFIEMLKNGALRLFASSKNDSDKRKNALEGNLDGRVKLKIGKLEADTSSEAPEEDEDNPCPSFDDYDEKPREDSVTGYLESGINLYVDGKDNKNNGFQMLLEDEGNFKVKTTGNSHFQVDKQEKIYVKEKSTGTYDDKYLRRVGTDSMNLAKSSNTIQGLPINLVLSSASFDSCGGGSGGSGGEGLIQLGIGSQITEDENGNVKMEGGTVVKATPNNTQSPTSITFDFGELTEVIFQNFDTMKFLGNVEVGGADAKPVGIEGSETSFNGGDSHNHKLFKKLSQSLKATEGAAAGNTRGAE